MNLPKDVVKSAALFKVLKLAKERGHDDIYRSFFKAAGLHMIEALLPLMLTGELSSDERVATMFMTEYFSKEGDLDKMLESFLDNNQVLGRLNAEAIEHLDRLSSIEAERVLEIELEKKRARAAQTASDG